MVFTGPSLLLGLILLRSLLFLVKYPNNALFLQLDTLLGCFVTIHICRGLEFEVA